MSAVFLKLLNMSITAGWLIIAVILARLLIRKAPKWIACLLWALVAVRLICPFSPESALSLIPSGETIPADIALLQSPRIDSGIAVVNETVNPMISGYFAPEPTAGANPLQVLIAFAAVIWLAGVAAMLLCALISYLRLRKTVSASVPAGEGIMACDELSAPFILGAFRPVIYVPSSMGGETLDNVIAHERAHLKRRDHRWKPLGYLLLAVHWFNPLCWAAYVLLCRDIESACDEKVIRDMDKDGMAAYSQALLDCSRPRRGIAACPLAFGEEGVRARVKGVLNYKKPAFWIVSIALILCAALAVCLMTNPFSDRSLSGKLGVSMDTAVAERHRSPHTEDCFAAVDYDVLKITRDADKTTVYARVFYEAFRREGSDIVVESGSWGPAVISFDTSSGGDRSTYDVIEYWEPRDGGYYAEDIRSKFPWTIRARALDVSGGERRHEKCLQAAREYFAAHPDGSVSREPEEELTIKGRLAYANWTGDSRIFFGCLNSDKMMISSVRHLPVYKFETAEELERFKDSFGDILTLDEGHDEAPSFNDATAAYDDGFFEKYTVMLAYMQAGSGSFRYAVGDVFIENGSVCMDVVQTNDPEAYTDDMAGWFVLAEIPAEAVEGCTEYDARFAGIYEK